MKKRTTTWRGHIGRRPRGERRRWGRPGLARLLPVAVAGLLWACERTAEDAAARDSIAAPELPRWLFAERAADDAIRAADSEEALAARFGEEVVGRDTIWLGEGEFAMGTVLFPRDPRRRIEIEWADTAGWKTPERIRVAAPESSEWQVYPGVGMRTSLRELEALNGRPFTLYGFGWDYGGTVDSWQGGRLDSLWGKRVMLRLTPGPAAPDAQMRAVLGDRVYPSSHAAMQTLNPRVYEMLIQPR